MEDETIETIPVCEKLREEYKVSIGKVQVNVTAHANGKLSIDPYSGRSFNFCHSDKEMVETIGKLLIAASKLAVKELQ